MQTQIVFHSACLHTLVGCTTGLLHPHSHHLGDQVRIQAIQSASLADRQALPCIRRKALEALCVLYAQLCPDACLEGTMLGKVDIEITQLRLAAELGYLSSLGWL